MQKGDYTAVTGDRPSIDGHTKTYKSSAKVTQGRKKSEGAFKTISEVADELGVQQHVLRFWETKFSYVKPLKRGGGRRYYRPEDVLLLKAIQHLLYTEGYTIKGVQKLLRTQGKKHVMQALPEAGNSNEPFIEPDVSNQFDQQTTQQPAAQDATQTAGGNLSSKQQEALQSMLSELKALRNYLSE